MSEREVYNYQVAVDDSGVFIRPIATWTLPMLHKVQSLVFDISGVIGTWIIDPESDRLPDSMKGEPPVLKMAASEVTKGSAIAAQVMGQAKTVIADYDLLREAFTPCDGQTVSEEQLSALLRQGTKAKISLEREARGHATGK